jgi:hypothetical protein
MAKKKTAEPVGVPSPNNENGSSQRVAEGGVVWLPADNGYAIGVHEGKLVSRNQQGKQLASVPKAVKQSELAEQLEAMCEWLVEHRTDCLRRIELWMLRSLPVPTSVIASVWPDEDWRQLLTNLVVAAVDGKGGLDATNLGLLRGVDTSKGIGVVDRDGETRWLDSPAIFIPHPILIDGLEDLRGIAADMSFSQSVEQLFRTVYPSSESQRAEDRVSEFANGKFAQLNFADSLCRRLGYPVRGGYACCRVWEHEAPIEARYWIGADAPEVETYTGDLIWVDSLQAVRKIANVGAVAFSEGMRMASQIYAKREVDKEEGGS